LAKLRYQKKKKKNEVYVLLMYRNHSILKRVEFVFHKHKIHHCTQNGSGAHPASYPIGSGGSFPWGKGAGA
jgi:hypothetical protein